MYMRKFQMNRVIDTCYKAKCDVVLQELSLLVPVVTLTHCSREIGKRVIGKQCRPRSDAAKCGI